MDAKLSEVSTGGGGMTTGAIMGVSFAAGMVLDFLHALIGFTAEITPGQATLLVGFLGLVIQQVNKFFERRAARKAMAGHTKSGSAA